MIKARVIPKSWLKRPSRRSSTYLWREGFKPKVETLAVSNDRRARLWRLQSSPEGQGGHQIDLFIDQSSLLEECLLAYGGAANLMLALSDVIKDQQEQVKRLRGHNRKLQHKLKSSLD